MQLAGNGRLLIMIAKLPDMRILACNSSFIRLSGVILAIAWALAPWKM
jgi:hypothetical protein